MPKVFKWMIKCILPLTILGMAFWVTSRYEEIKRTASNETALSLEEEMFTEHLQEISNTLYQRLLRDIHGDDFSPMDWVEITRPFDEWEYREWLQNSQESSINEPGVVEEFESWAEEIAEEVTEEETVSDYPDFSAVTADVRREATEQFVLANIENSFINQLADLEHNYPNLNYFAIENESETYFLNGNENLRNLVQGNITEQLLREIADEYRFVLVYNFNEAGEIENSLQLNPHNMNEILTTNQNLNLENLGLTWGAYQEFMRLNQGNYEWSPMKNTTFVFALPNELIYSDIFSWNRMQSLTWQVEDALMYHVLFTSSVMVLVAFIVPVKLVSEGPFMKGLLRLPLEIVPIGMSIAMFFIIMMLHQAIPQLILENVTFNWSELTQENFEMILIQILNVGVWILLFTAITYCILYIKNFFKDGIKTSIRNNSLIVKAGIGAYKLMFIDLKKPGTMKLFLLVFAQFIIFAVVTFPIAFTEGAIYVLIFLAGGLYSTILFIILNKRLNGIRKNYLRLFEVTHELSTGNLDIQIEEDLGIFNSIKNELAQIKTGFKKAVENETTSQRMKGDLIANVSHDLKTPLTSIITYVDLLKDENLDLEKREQYLLILDQKSNRLKVLIEDLFEMSKVSSGDIILDWQEIDVISLLKQTLNELEDKIEEKQLLIRKNFPGHKVKLNLDGARTYRVFENLILNMTKYALPNTRAYIDVLDEEEHVTIILRNISASELNVEMNELTERFVRGDQSRHTEGSGLGLAIAKSLVELQNGTFSVYVDGDLFKVVMIFIKE